MGVEALRKCEKKINQGKAEMGSSKTVQICRHRVRELILVQKSTEARKREK
jgi:ribosomal protein L30E